MGEEKLYEYLLEIPVREFHTYRYKITASSDEEAMKKYRCGDTIWEEDEFLYDEDDGELVIVSKEEI